MHPFSFTRSRSQRSSKSGEGSRIKRSSKMENIIEELIEMNWALLDVEFIRISPTHRCIRKLYILGANGYSDMDREFYPCKQYKDLNRKYQRSFQYCKQHIHKLTYSPKKYSAECAQVLRKLNQFIVNNGIELVLYKGGTIERDLCEALNIPSFNIENLEGLKKANSHDPRTEVDCYYSQIIKLL